MKIMSVSPGSQAEECGILPGDELLEIDGYPARDQLDLMFHGAEDELEMLVARNGSEFMVYIDGSEDWGFECEQMKFGACGNHCLFCFIDQNPRGMRREIYFKDEDYRLSFLYGSYVTLTAITDSDIARIIEQRLSPLYVSVHATDPAVRMKLLGLKSEDRLLEKIDTLTAAGITIHTQAVVCPQINDGIVLEQTMETLYSRFPGVASLAVVPVGLTKHRDNLPHLAPVDELVAKDTIERVDRFREKIGNRDGNGFVYCADEWYIRAGMDVPDDSYYDDYSQLENGVGMLRQFIDSLTALEQEESAHIPAGKYVLITGVSMGPYIARFAELLSKSAGVEVSALPIENMFYGKTVTVSGLLTGEDIHRALMTSDKTAVAVLPPNCLNDDGVFLDGMSPDEIAAATGMRIVQGYYDPAETVELLSDNE